jgi:hypothetical protein
MRREPAANGKISPLLIIGMATLAVALALGWYLIGKVFDRPNDLLNACAQALPQDQRIGLKIEPRGNNGISIDLGGSKQTGATPEQIEQIVKCYELTKKTVIIENGVRIPLEPLGQVANRWQREAGLKLVLMPGENNEVLNNLRIGPATGHKEDVVRMWCDKEHAGSCVSCEPDQPSDDSQVLVRLRKDAPIEKTRLPGTWPAPQTGIETEPWQLVNKQGERFYYECKK